MVDKVMAAQRAGQTLQVARKDAVARNQLGIAKQAALTMDTNEVVYQGAMDEYVCCGVAPDSALRVRLLRLVRPISPLHLPYISHIPPYTSPISPLYLPYLEGVEVVHAARDVAADARRRLAPGQGEGEGEGDLLTCLLTD